MIRERDDAKRGRFTMEHAKIFRVSVARDGHPLEPSLRDVLADPLVHAIMRRDGVSRGALDSVIAHARQRLHLAVR
jgi:hypothetical protein